MEQNLNTLQYLQSLNDKVRLSQKRKMLQDLNVCLGYTHASDHLSCTEQTKKQLAKVSQSWNTQVDKVLSQVDVCFEQSRTETAARECAQKVAAEVTNLEARHRDLLT